MFSRIHLPRLTGEVRVGLDVAVKNARLVEDAAPRRAG